MSTEKMDVTETDCFHYATNKEDGKAIRDYLDGKPDLTGSKTWARVSGKKVPIAIVVVALTVVMTIAFITANAVSDGYLVPSSWIFLIPVPTAIFAIVMFGGDKIDEIMLNRKIPEVTVADSPGIRVHTDHDNIADLVREAGKAITLPKRVLTDLDILESGDGNTDTAVHSLTQHLLSREDAIDQGVEERRIELSDNLNKFFLDNTYVDLVDKVLGKSYRYDDVMVDIARDNVLTALQAYRDMSEDGAGTEYYLRGKVAAAGRELADAIQDSENAAAEIENGGDASEFADRIEYDMAKMKDNSSLGIAKVMFGDA